jgi:ribosome-associated protein
VDEEAPPEAGPLLVVTRHCRIPLSELTWRFTTSGGPGGQHANRSHTAAEVSFDVAGSASLGPRQRTRLLDRLGPIARASASDERSQLRNRDLALERLRSRLAAALAVDKPRVATRPSRAAKERRLEDKRRNAQRKRSRQLRDGPEG